MTDPSPTDWNSLKDAARKQNAYLSGIGALRGNVGLLMEAVDLLDGRIFRLENPDPRPAPVYAHSSFQDRIEGRDAKIAELEEANRDLESRVDMLEARVARRDDKIANLREVLNEVRRNNANLRRRLNDAYRAAKRDPRISYRRHLENVRCALGMGPLG